MAKRTRSNSCPRNKKKVKAPKTPKSTCTCNNCIDGWLSPRTIEVLCLSAMVASDNLAEELKNSHNCTVNSTPEQLQVVLPYLPSHIIEHPVYVIYMKGLLGCFKDITNAFEQKKDSLPFHTPL
eukprot:TRINITY_DN7661_c0_g1_i1.p1 TRINITY_DN7661_c0_g1~~TRINITY_DN7661_c0_g1_i1.p1  ORF type:complete len:124 (-),score=8.65 TRINITY_DN7661_c0_g1_i1:243-614(-)